MGRFDGKVVLITGGARGQGRSHALKFASEGADVAFCDIAAQIDTVPYPMAGQADLDETVKLVEDLDRRCVGVVADVRDLGPGAAFVDAGQHRAGPRRLPAGQRRDLLLRHGRRDGRPTWQDMIDTNLTGVFHAMRAVLPDHDRAELRPDRGHVVDGRASSGFANVGHYVAAKWGVIGLVKSVAHGGRRGTGSRSTRSARPTWTPT